MRADEVGYEEDEREPADGDGVEEGRDVDEEEEEDEEGISFDWVYIF